MDKPVWQAGRGRSAFPRAAGAAPFSTWISPNNFGDFHSNPLMSLLTGSGQIEYPSAPWSDAKRFDCITHRCRDTDYTTTRCESLRCVQREGVSFVKRHAASSGWQIRVSRGWFRRGGGCEGFVGSTRRFRNWNFSLLFIAIETLATEGEIIRIVADSRI